MTDANPTEIGTAVVPVMRYRDLPAAIDWLCEAFGFETHSVTAGRDGAIAFAHLTFGSAMVMLGPVRKTAFDKYLRQPDEIGGAETQVCYFFVADVQAHCARARAAGAQIVFDIEDWANGGRSYSCRDPEGHLWNFGDYNPWPRQTVKEPEPASHERSRGGGAWPTALAAGVLVGATAMVVAAGGVPDAVLSLVREAAPANTSATAAMRRDEAPGGTEKERNGRTSGERMADEAQEALRAARKDREVAERATAEARAELAQTVGAKRAVDAVATELHRQLMEARQDREAAEQAVRSVHDRLRAARVGRAIAERAAREARKKLAEERNAKGSSLFLFGGKAPAGGGE